MRILFLAELALKKPKWFIPHLKAYMGFLERWVKQVFDLNIKFSYGKLVTDYEWITLLTWEFLDHPLNAIVDEAGWCDPISKTIYVRCLRPRWFTRLSQWFRLGLTPEQWWQNYNGWKITHELAHLAYRELIILGLETRDRTHDFSVFDRQYWTEDFKETAFKAKDWLFVTQKVR